MLLLLHKLQGFFCGTEAEFDDLCEQFDKVQSNVVHHCWQADIIKILFSELNLK